MLGWLAISFEVLELSIRISWAVVVVYGSAFLISALASEFRFLLKAKISGDFTVLQIDRNKLEIVGRGQFEKKSYTKTRRLIAYLLLDGFAQQL